jgi:hypothetical protein
MPNGSIANFIADSIADSIADFIGSLGRLG